jgi:hypothetical protein
VGCYGDLAVKKHNGTDVIIMLIIFPMVLASLSTVNNGGCPPVGSENSDTDHNGAEAKIA